MTAEAHVLFGCGQVGRPLARILLARGKRVRIDRRFRARFGQEPEAVERAAADTVAWAKAHYAGG